jgi:hypothetical protein
MASYILIMKNFCRVLNLLRPLSLSLNTGDSIFYTIT